MAFSDKVNLQVKVPSSGDNGIQIAFKFISYENTPVNLSDYRVVGYFNTHKNSNLLLVERTLAGYPSGSTSGSLAYTAGYINQDFTTVSNPPRIYPPNQRYDKEVIFPLSGTAACLTAGSFFENLLFQMHFTTWQAFVAENEGSADYLVGQAALATSYSFEDSTSYVENSSFVLEYNDPIHGWIKVQEYTDASTVDTETGLYPYDDIYEEQKSIGNTNRLYGIDTNYDHDGILVSLDGYIDELNPTSAYYNSTSVVLNGSASTRIGLFKFSTESLSDKILSATKFYAFIEDSDQAISLDCSLNAVDFDSSSTWNSLSGWDGTDGTLQSQLNIDLSFQYLKTYVSFDIDETVVQDWQTTSANNFGINLRYTDPIDKSGYSSPEFLLSESTSANKPMLVVYSGPISASTIKYIRWEGGTSELWSEPTNWEGGEVPTETDVAVFDVDFSLNSCILDDDYSVLNITGTSAEYTCALSLSSNTLTLYSTLSAIDFTFIATSAIDCSASSIIVRGDVDVYFPQVDIYSIELLNGANLKNNVFVNQFICDNATISMDNYLTLNITTSGYMNVQNGSAFTGGTSTKILFDEFSTISSTGDINNCIFEYTGSSNITSREYDGDLIIKIVNQYVDDHTLINNVNFTSGTCTVNGQFKITDTAYIDSFMIVDMSANNTQFNIVGDFSVSNDYLRSSAVNLIFPANEISIGGNVYISNLLAETNNYENCVLNLIGDNEVSCYFANTIPNIIYPKIQKTDAGSILFKTLLSNVIFYDLEIGSSAFNTTPSFTCNQLNVLNSIDIYHDDGLTLNNIYFSADQIKFYGESLSNLLTLNGSSWSADATTSLNAYYAEILNSYATSATGYALKSTDLGGNTNWFFDSVPPLILEVSANPSHYSQSSITASYVVTDETGFDYTTIGLTNDFGEIANMTSHSETCATFDVIISGSQKCGEVSISAKDYGENYSEFTSLPFSYDYTSPSISIISVSPESGISNGFITINVSAHDNCILSGDQQVFDVTFNSQPASLLSVTYSDYNNATSVWKLSSTSAVTNGDLYISATDAALNTNVFYSSAFTIATIAPEITFLANPSFKIGSTIIQMSAIFDDSTGMSQTIPYKMRYNDAPIAFDTIYVTANRTILSAIIPSTLGAGEISVTGYNVAGTSATAIDSGYDFVPVIYFGTPVPSNISQSLITVPISAVGNFVEDPEYYYVRLSGTRMPISTPTSGLLEILGYDFYYLSFSATVSALEDLRGDLIISAGYR